MSAHKASLINGFILVLMGIWGAYSTNFSAPTAFIPVAFGLLILIFNNYLKRENKLMSHVIVGLTVLILIALAMPLSRALKTDSNTAMVRILIMMASCFYALYYFIQSFRQARKS
jgi:uncharacterized membrane protein